MEMKATSLLPVWSRLFVRLVLPVCLRWGLSFKSVNDIISVITTSSASNGDSHIRNRHGKTNLTGSLSCRAAVRVKPRPHQ